MRTATLRFHCRTEVVEFRIIAFEQGGVSAWRMHEGAASARNINFDASEQANPEVAIRNAACVLTMWHADAASELVIDP